MTEAKRKLSVVNTAVKDIEDNPKEIAKKIKKTRRERSTLTMNRLSKKFDI